MHQRSENTSQTSCLPSQKIASQVWECCSEPFVSVGPESCWICQILFPKSAGYASRLQSRLNTKIWFWTANRPLTWLSAGIRNRKTQLCWSRCSSFVSSATTAIQIGTFKQDLLVFPRTQTRHWVICSRRIKRYAFIALDPFIQLTTNRVQTVESHLVCRGCLPQHRANKKVCPCISTENSTPSSSQNSGFTTPVTPLSTPTSTPMQLQPFQSNSIQAPPVGKQYPSKLLAFLDDIQKQTRHKRYYSTKSQFFFGY